MTIQQASLSNILPTKLPLPKSLDEPDYTHELNPIRSLESDPTHEPGTNFEPDPIHEPDPSLEPDHIPTS